MRRMTCARAVLLVGVFACGVAVAGAAGVDEPVRTNLDVVTELSTKVVGELVSEFEHRISSRGVLLAPFGGGEEYHFATNVFATVLNQKGVKTFMPASAVGSGETAYRLEYQMMEFSLRYTDISRRYLIGGRRVTREAGVTILVKLIDPEDGSVVWIGEASDNHDDQFSFGKVKRAEEGTFEFTKPERPTSSMTRFIEPVFVSGIIVGLIYLFFSNQSDS